MDTIPAEPVPEFQIEPEVAGPPPRPARLPLGTTILLTVAVILFTLFLYGGCRALIESFKLAWLGIAGHTVTARIKTVVWEAPPVKASPAPQPAPPSGQANPTPRQPATPRQTGIWYEYPDLATGGRTVRRGYAALYTGDPAEAASGGDTLDNPSRRQPSASPPPAMPVFRVNQPLPLRTAVWFGGPISHPWSPPPYGKMLFLALSGGLVVVVTLLLLRRILHWNRRRIHLVRYGLATVGTIIHKYANTDDSLRYFLRYGYAVSGGPLREHEEQCNADQWKRFEVGQPVTVLYDPAHPEDASLYALLSKQ